jgi:uncharacterized membrane protein
MSSNPTPTSHPAEPPNAETPKSAPEKIKNTLEVFGKIVIGLVGLCYVLGLIVVTLHLRRYALNSLDLPQLHYVMAGVWAMMPILLTLLLVVFILYVYEVSAVELRLDPTKAEKKVTEKITDWLSPAASFILLFYIAFGFFGSRFGLSFTWKSWVFIPLLGTAAALFITAPAFLFTRWEEFGQRSAIFLNLGALAIGILLGLLYLVVFTSNTYETIPWSTGGGRPSRVQLVIDSAARPYTAQVGINLPGMGDKTESLDLLLTTEKEYVVLNAYGAAVSIPSDSVKAVIYEK